MERACRSSACAGVKTNIPFLLNVVTHPAFLAGDCTTRFLDETPELFRFPIRQDRATRLLTYAAEVTVNGFPGVTRPAGLCHGAGARAAAIRSADRRRRPGRGSGSRRWGPTRSPAGSASSSRCS